jgi:hypothetical protein
VRRLSYAVVIAALGLAGCGVRAGTLSVDLVSDLLPGVEIFAARTSVIAAGVDPEPIPAERFELATTTDLTEGARIAEVRALPPGDYHAVLELLDASGDPIVTRRVDVRINGSLTIRIVVTRDCVFMGCPGPADPETSTECLAGHCVSPACADGSCATAECQTDGDCPPPVADCAANLCRDGVCLSFVTRGVCAVGTACSPDEGCVPVTVPEDPTLDLDDDGVVGPDDCDPDDPTVGAGSPEICEDGIDQDCDGLDLSCPPDADGDGWDVLSDCDDMNAAVSPEEDDACGDGADTDCDGYDQPCAPIDLDHDQWSVPLDCNDGNVLVHPTAIDICADGIDQDCSGEDSRSCIGNYGQPCGPRGTCLESRLQRLACTRANGERRRSCLRCCVLCASQSRYHWLNVDHDCSRAAARYCAHAGRGGLETTSGVDPIQWGTCSR